MKDEGRRKKEEKTLARGFYLNPEATVREKIHSLPSSLFLLPS
jgi:hypothetical protein